MFISVLDLFKVGIGPSSSHTIGPMVAAKRFRDLLLANEDTCLDVQLVCRLKGSLALTGRGHATDKAVLLGLHGYLPSMLLEQDVDALCVQLQHHHQLSNSSLQFQLDRDLYFDLHDSLAAHPNGLVFYAYRQQQLLCQQSYFSIGGGFVHTEKELSQLIQHTASSSVPFGFANAREMLQMSRDSGLSIAAMKRANELASRDEASLDQGLAQIWVAMLRCLQRGLNSEGILPGGLKVPRRAHALHQQLLARPEQAGIHDWLAAYAMAVNEENAAGHLVVTAPTNGAAGVIPAVLYLLSQQHVLSITQIADFLLVAAAIGGIIKHNSSISGAEVGCQGEVGTAAAMAAAGLCAVRGGSSAQIEHAAEIALEHHLGMTCDPVAGLVQIPCIERNAFGAVKAYTAASLALRSNGQHLMALDACIAAMKQTGQEMSHKFKETSLGGLAVSFTAC